MSIAPFPPNPTIGDTHLSNDVLYTWTGQAWTATEVTAFLESTPSLGLNQVLAPSADADIPLTVSPFSATQAVPLMIFTDSAGRALISVMPDGRIASTVEAAQPNEYATKGYIDNIIKGNDFRGVEDFTIPPPPGVPGILSSGDYYINTANGIIDPGWIGSGGAVTTLEDRVIWDGALFHHQHVDPISGNPLKADKVLGAINNDLATLDNTGNIKDSGLALSRVMTTAGGVFTGPLSYNAHFNPASITSLVDKKYVDDAISSGSTLYASNPEVEAGIVADKSLAPNTLRTEIVRTLGVSAAKITSPNSASTDTSAGAANSGELVKLGSDGKINPNMINLTTMIPKGGIDLTQVYIGPNVPGDTYFHNGVAGVVGAGWVGITGESVQPGDSAHMDIDNKWHVLSNVTDIDLAVLKDPGGGAIQTILGGLHIGSGTSNQNFDVFGDIRAHSDLMAISLVGVGIRNLGVDASGKLVPFVIPGHVLTGPTTDQTIAGAHKLILSGGGNLEAFGQVHSHTDLLSGTLAGTGIRNVGADATGKLVPLIIPGHVLTAPTGDQTIAGSHKLTLSGGGNIEATGLIRTHTDLVSDALAGGGLRNIGVDNDGIIVINTPPASVLITPAGDQTINGAHKLILGAGGNLEAFGQVRSHTNLVSDALTGTGVRNIGVDANGVIVENALNNFVLLLPGGGSQTIVGGLQIGSTGVGNAKDLIVTGTSDITGAVTARGALTLTSFNADAGKHYSLLVDNAGIVSVAAGEYLLRSDLVPVRGTGPAYPSASKVPQLNGAGQLDSSFISISAMVFRSSLDMVNNPVPAGIHSPGDFYINTGPGSAGNADNSWGVPPFHVHPDDVMIFEETGAAGSGVGKWHYLGSASIGTLSAYIRADGGTDFVAQQNMPVPPTLDPHLMTLGYANLNYVHLSKSSNVTGQITVTGKVIKAATAPSANDDLANKGYVDLFVKLAAPFPTGSPQIIKSHLQLGVLTDKYNLTVYGSSDHRGQFTAEDNITFKKMTSADGKGLLKVSPTGVVTVDSDRYALKSLVDTNTTAIASNTGHITNHTTGIINNRTDIATNTGNITTNTTNITTNRNGVSTNTGNITTNRNSISTNTGNITTNTRNITTNRNGVATNKTAIAHNATGIATNKTAIARNATLIASNSTNISGNTANITTNRNGIGTNRTAITANTNGRIDGVSMRSTTLHISRHVGSDFTTNLATGLDPHFVKKSSDTMTGPLQVGSGGKKLIKTEAGKGVTLYYNNNPKVETVNLGVNLYTSILFSTSFTAGLITANHSGLGLISNITTNNTSSVALRATNTGGVSQACVISVNGGAFGRAGAYAKLQGNGVTWLSTHETGGQLHGTGWIGAIPSDSDIKDNQTPVIGALDRLLLLEPMTWDWKTPEDHIEQLTKGFIAQNWALSYPDEVATTPPLEDEEGVELPPEDQPDYVGKLSINRPIHGDHFTDTVSAIKELHAMIEAQAARIEQLEMA